MEPVADLPQHIGPYRVLQSIAAGGMAEVYEVEDPASGERLALKMLQNLKVALKRFNREYEAMSRLNHPGVVRVYHYGLHHGRPWITMELLRGTNTHLWVKRFGMPGAKEREDEVLRVVYHLATALHYVHDRGLVHRDVKSANVLVLPDTRVKLVDFGTAHLVDATERITRDGEFVGTFAYASPEQLTGAPVSRKSDLYALGVLMYRLTTGRRPFAARDPGELAWQHLHEPPRDPREWVPETPAPLAELTLSLLAKDPADRPAHAGLVAEAIERLAGRPYSTRHAVTLHQPRSTGRHRERVRLWGELEGLVAHRALVVTGEPGSDGDRFLGDLVADASGRGWTAVSTRLQRGRDLTPLARLLAGLARGLESVDGVDRAVATIRTHAALERRTHPESRAALAAAAVRLIRERVARSGKPVLVAVSEAGWAGPIAADLLDRVSTALRADAVPSVVAVGARRVDLQADRPLAAFAARATEVWLEALSEAEVAHATGYMLGHRPPPAHLARALHTRSGGQPVYLEEVVRDLVGSREVEAEDNRLAWSERDISVPWPRRALADAEAMVRDLPVCWLRVLQVLAVIDGLTPALVAGTLGWEVEALDVALERLCSLGVLRRGAGAEDGLSWGQPAILEVVRRGVAPTRRRAWVRAVARLVEGAPPSAVKVRALAADGRTVEALSTAASVCRELVQERRVRTALSLLEPLMRRLGGTSLPNRPDLAEAFLQYSLALQAVKPRHPDTRRALQVARGLSAGAPAMAARVAWGQAALERAIGHHRNHLEHAAEALAALTSQGAEALADRVAAQLDVAWALLREGSVQRAHDAFAGVEELGRGMGDLRAAGRAAMGIARCVARRGELREAASVASVAMSQLERLGDRHGFWFALAVWARAVRRQMRYSDALSVLYQRAPEARHAEDPLPYAHLLLALAWCELDLERLGRAQEYVDELNAILDKGQHLDVRLETGLAHGRILLASGQSRLASYLLQDVEQRARLADLRVLAEQARAWHAEALWALGDREVARSMYQSSILGLMGIRARPALADACISRARSMLHEEDPDRLFQPVQSWMDAGAPPALRLEELLARGAAARRAGQREACRAAHREAAMVLNRVATHLSDTDRAALRVHSWSRRIREGL